MTHIYPPDEDHRSRGCSCGPVVIRDYIIHRGRTGIGHYCMELCEVLVAWNFQMTYLPTQRRFWSIDAGVMLTLTEDPMFPVLLTYFDDAPRAVKAYIREYYPH